MKPIQSHYWKKPKEFRDLLIPDYTIKQYPNGSKGFRAEKRRQLRELEECLNKFCSGCAYIPYGREHVKAIESHIEALKEAMCRENWGQ